MSVPEYALMLAVAVTLTVGAIVALQTRSEEYLDDSGSAIGRPRGLASDFGLDDPVTPPWLTQPPPPTPAPNNIRGALDGSTEGQIMSVRLSGLCLGVRGASTNDGAVVEQQQCTGEEHQHWRLVDSGSYKLIKAVHSDKCLTVKEPPPPPPPPTTVPTTLDPSDPPPPVLPPPQWWVDWNNDYLDWPNHRNGDPLLQWTCWDGVVNRPDGSTWDGSNQRVAFQSHPSRAFRLRMEHSGKCLEIRDSLLVAGADGRQWDCADNENQAFDLS